MRHLLILEYSPTILPADFIHLCKQMKGLQEAKEQLCNSKVHYWHIPFRTAFTIIKDLLIRLPISK